MSTSRTHLNERYGVSNSASRTLAGRIALGFVAAIFIATVLWVAYVFISETSVKSSTLRYSHVSESELEVGFSVTMAPGTAARCGIEALNAQHAQVGFVVVDIAPQTERISTHSVRLTTQQPAVTGVVKFCEQSQ